MPLGPRKRSQRKASGLANAAITLQSADGYDGTSAGPSGGGILAPATSSSRLLPILSRPMTVRERQLLEEERQEKEDREVSVKRRKLQKRLDELERTNYRDAIGSAAARGGNEASSRNNDGESFSIPNSALAAARSLQEDRRGKGKSSSFLMAGSPVDFDTQEASASGKRADTDSKKQSAAVRRLLSYRRGFYALLEEASGDDIFLKSRFHYLTASSVADKARLASIAVDQKTSSAGNKVTLYPRKPIFCTICNDAGSTSCPRCGERTCSQSSCLETHNDTRCDRPIR